MDKANDIIVVTGGRGFLGRHVCRELVSRGYKGVVSITSSDKGVRVPGVRYQTCDLLNEREVQKAFRFNSPYKRIEGNIRGVIHLAAVVGGIGANKKNPGKFMMDNLKMGVHLIEAAKGRKSMHNGGKFVQIGTVCAYPKHCPIPFEEESLWNGYPEETNAPYGIAKRTLMELVASYNKQYPRQFNGINLIPVNLYGPGDNFDLETSHVIPAIIRKIDDAIKNHDGEVWLWGTGEASREFLFVKDAARGIADAFEKYQGSEPINLGTGIEIKINTLAKTIAEIMGYNGNIYFDSTKPDGQPRRCLNTDKAFEKFGFKSTTSLVEGLTDTINWYKETDVK